MTRFGSAFLVGVLAAAFGCGDRAREPEASSGSAPVQLPEQRTGVGTVVSHAAKFGVTMIDAGSEHGIKPGERLLVTRDGQFVATLVVDQVFPKRSTAAHEGEGVPRPGDIVTRP